MSKRLNMTRGAREVSGTWDYRDANVSSGKSAPASFQDQRPSRAKTKVICSLLDRNNNRAAFARRRQLQGHLPMACNIVGTRDGIHNSKGQPRRPAGKGPERRHQLLVYQGNWTSNRSPTLAGEPIHAGHIVSTFNTSLMLRSAVKAGLGIGELPIHLAEHDGLVQIWPEPARGAVYEIWLVTHQDLRHTARITAMTEHIVAAFEDHTTHTKQACTRSDDRMKRF
jgi:hypothetical protein